MSLSSNLKKLTAFAFALLWTIFLVWSCGPAEPVNVVLMAICGGLAGWCIYLAMLF